MWHDKRAWQALIGTPQNYDYTPSWELKENYHFDFGDVEYYLQANGPGTFQRVAMCFPVGLSSPVPAVVTPFYFPEEMLGFDPATGDVLEQFTEIAMMKHLAERGFATISGEAYHLTYLPDLDLEPGAWKRWGLAGIALLRDHPEWSGMGKLIADTQLLIDAISADSRVDARHISIAGHSLGGKMAFYTGMLDDRIQAVLTSDFGIGWEQTNWQDPWYWGDKLKTLQQEQFCHSELLTVGGGKPFALLAGKYDNADSWKIIQQAQGYEEHSERLLFINHATGHRPPWDVLKQGYEFLEKFGK